MESKQQHAEAEPPAPVENQNEAVPTKSTGFGTEGEDEGWVEKGAEESGGDQGENTGKGIGHFTVVYSVTRPMNCSEAAGDLVLIQTSQFLSCKLCCCDAN